MGGFKWIRPEVYPLFAAVGAAVGICGLQLVRNICINPEVRVTKEKRAAGVLDNHSEGGNMFVANPQKSSEVLLKHFAFWTIILTRVSRVRAEYPDQLDYNGLIVHLPNSRNTMY